jgi:excisionase family DNA binding protein
VHRDWRPRMHEEHSASAALSNAGQDSDRLAYSVAEAARRLDVSRMTLYREIAAGRLAAIRIRDRLVIPRTALERLVEDAILAAAGSGPGGDSDAA